MWIALALLVVVVLMLRFVRPGMPSDLGIKNGRLADCPSSPNCVMSQTDSLPHKVEPLPYSGTAEQTRDRLKSVFEQEKGWTWVIEKEAYWHLEYRTRWMGYVDDVEFLFVDDEQTVHVRSASRLGYSDLGANRTRVERLRSVLTP